MDNKLGILIAGYCGAISSTVVAGIDLMLQGSLPNIGMICETTDSNNTTIAEQLDAPKLENIVISGWDAIDVSIRDALNQHQVLRVSDIALVSDSVMDKRPMPIPQNNDKFEYNNGWGSHIEQLRRDIREFKDNFQVDNVVVVNSISTQPTPTWTNKYDSLAEFKSACKALDPDITASMEYACAAILESSGYVNFTPNIVSVPALQELAVQKGVPLTGHDGKTGQTLIKTALAPLLKLRNLTVKGWFSTNILGNLDGKALNDPDACQTKITSKQNCLDSILGYPVEDHQVHIHYYLPRKDNKESWDSIDIDGFLGYPMQIKVNYLCRDSIIAAPLVIDLARLMAVSMRQGESGLLPHLSIFFKSPQLPEGIPVNHDLFIQRKLFFEWVKRSGK
ncbi:MAG: inositol-3-phosphate synthase [Candidatus Hatepunaea meridiana]|nr:inositol-3-phosphate synthase [Candidatus Hatepunaea meridiana]